MAYLLKSCTVTDFLGRDKLTFDFNRDVNFLIGKNGTGKTTFVRLLSAALMLDRDELSRIPFSNITITFSDDATGSSPQYKIENTLHSRRAFTVSFRHSLRAKYKVFTDRAGLELPFAYNQGSKNSDRHAEARRHAGLIADFRKAFLSNVNMTWLPLLRARTAGPTPYDDSDFDDEPQNPIDRKIQDIVGNITRYFSRLDSKAASETRNFQRDYFLSLLDYSPTDVLPSARAQGPEYYSGLERVMHEIFMELGFPESDFAKQIAAHFLRVQTSSKRIQEASVRVDDYFAIADTNRLSKVVDRFKEYEKRKQLIFSPREQFVSLMNNLLINKTFEFTSSNEPKVKKYNDSEPVSLFDLSSGEKQIFVILAESLLQENRPFVFLADEPELSLHVEWQESIVRNIRSLNENCQIVFATHSPDVVSSYQDQVIDFSQI